MTRATEVAGYIISMMKDEASGTEPEENDLTPLKLQKLLYYCQGYSLALTGKPAFEEEIEAWRLGPVVESVYQEYKKYNRKIIPYSSFESEPDEVLKSIIRLVLSDKRLFSGEALSQATHKERPWVESYKGDYKNARISQELMKEYFSSEIQRREEDDDDEDEAWKSIAEPLSIKELEFLLEEI